MATILWLRLFNSHPKCLLSPNSKIFLKHRVCPHLCKDTLLSQQDSKTRILFKVKWVVACRLINFSKLKVPLLVAMDKIHKCLNNLWVDNRCSNRWRVRIHKEITRTINNSGITSIIKDTWPISQVSNKIMECTKWCQTWTHNITKWWCKGICKTSNTDKLLGNTQCQCLILIIWTNKCRVVQEGCILKINSAIWCKMISKWKECKENNPETIRSRVRKVINQEMVVHKAWHKQLARVAFKQSNNQRANS